MNSAIENFIRKNNVKKVDSTIKSTLKVDHKIDTQDPPTF